MGSGPFGTIFQPNLRAPPKCPAISPKCPTLVFAKVSHKHLR